MAYKWDNKKPTAQMLGRWQPFHDGHYALFQEIIKKTGQVCIQIRDVQGVDDNPFNFETVKKNIEEKLNPEFEGQFKVMMALLRSFFCNGFFEILCHISNQWSKETCSNNYECRNY